MPNTQRPYIKALCFHSSINVSYLRSIDTDILHETFELITVRETKFLFKMASCDFVSG